MKEAMKKYKIALGICGCNVLYSNIIKAHNEEEAVRKFISGEDREYSEEEIENLISKTVEYVSKPRKKKDSKVPKEMYPQLKSIMDKMGLILIDVMYDRIQWKVNASKLDYVLGIQHPGDVLDSILAKPMENVNAGTDIERTELEIMLAQLRKFKSAYSVKEMKEPIDDLFEFVKMIR